MFSEHDQSEGIQAGEQIEQAQLDAAAVQAQAAIVMPVKPAAAVMVGLAVKTG